MSIPRVSLGLVGMALLTACYHGSQPKGIGAPAPNFTVQDDERKAALDQFRGKVVVLNFWASWCAPCITETPSLVSMQERLKDKGVVVVAISADEDEDAYHASLSTMALISSRFASPARRLNTGTEPRNFQRATSLTEMGSCGEG